LDSDDVDAVTVVVPDHWHAIMTIMAAKAGKDVYCEKPLSLTLEEGKLMVQAVRDNHRILQTGSQHRSGPAARLACELVRNNRIGELVRIETFVPENNAVDPGPGWQESPVPEGFDYDMWLGPAPLAPYHPGRCFYRFRFNLDYSGGQVTNFGTHMLDIAQWGHGSDETGPVRFEDIGSEWPQPGSLYTTATKVAFRAYYEDGVELSCVTKPKTSLCRFVGTDGWVQYRSGKIETSEGLDTTIGPNDIQLPHSVPGRAENDYKQYLPDHVRNFLDCVKSREEPMSPVEYGHRTASICHLGNIAMRLKREVRWDPVGERILNDAEATGLLSKTPRSPWTYS
jgi:predicted dehydrogenase